MVVEHFAPGAKDKIYERFHQKGRRLPEGLHYLNSWLEKDGNRCFQLMETNDVRLFDVWLRTGKIWEASKSSRLAISQGKMVERLQRHARA